MVKVLLFETGLGQWVLCWFERLTGLAIVPADVVREIRAGAVVD